MAIIVPIAGGPETAKRRSVFAPAMLPFITFGIYGLVWYYKVNRELRDLGRKHGRDDLGTSPAISLLAVTFGVFLFLIPPIVSFANTYKRIKRAQQLVGVPDVQQANPWIVLWLCVFGQSLIAYGYLQNELNKVWISQDSSVVAAGAPHASTGPSFTKA